jgi:hypothetical protein
MNTEYIIEIEPKVNINVIKETLSRLGIANVKKKILYPSCYLYQDGGKYYIVHFKQLFLLSRKDAYNGICEEDMNRRNAVIYCLYTWGLIDVDLSEIDPHDTKIYVLNFKDKKNWYIKHKFNMFTLD